VQDRRHTGAGEGVPGPAAPPEIGPRPDALGVSARLIGDDGRECLRTPAGL